MSVRRRKATPAAPVHVQALHQAKDAVLLQDEVHQGVLVRRHQQVRQGAGAGLERRACGGEPVHLLGHQRQRCCVCHAHVHEPAGGGVSHATLVRRCGLQRARWPYVQPSSTTGGSWPSIKASSGRATRCSSSLALPQTICNGAASRFSSTSFTCRSHGGSRAGARGRDRNRNRNRPAPGVRAGSPASGRAVGSTRRLPATR